MAASINMIGMYIFPPLPSASAFPSRYTKGKTGMRKMEILVS
jgi:hypothetical protein